jgi:hypothetical protein
VGVTAHPRRCGLKYTPWPKRDPIKNCFQLPNEIFLLGLSPGTLAVCSYLLYTIRPIQLALDQFYEQQMVQMDVAAERQRAATALALRSKKSDSA